MPSTSRDVQAAPGPTPTSNPAIPSSINSNEASNPTVFPTSVGIPSSEISSLRISPRSERDRCLAVVTVD